jgi:hypothetical protein
VLCVGLGCVAALVCVVRAAGLVLVAGVVAEVRLLVADVLLLPQPAAARALTVAATKTALGKRLNKRLIRSLARTSYDAGILANSES